ncbi:MAG: hypothetical protein ACREGG_02205 [Candidatus Saccharimonadales bacterium]
MSEPEDLVESRAEAFRNMPEDAKQRFLHLEFLANQIVLRDENVATGIWTKEQAEEWGREFDEEIDALLPEEKEAIQNVADQIKAKKREMEG